MKFKFLASMGLPFLATRRYPVKEPQFQNIHRGLDLRWAKISKRLKKPPSWILDVGSNLGDTVARAAHLGHIVLGIEIEKELADFANNNRLPYTSIMHGRANPDFFSSMPPFDTVLMLSVLHRIWALEGPEYVEECVVKCLGKAPSSLFIEGSVRQERYTDLGQDPPDFPSNDLNAGVSWHISWLERLTQGMSFGVEYVGSVPCSNLEPFRPIFLIKNFSSHGHVSFTE